MKFDQFVFKIIVSALKVEIRTTKNKGIKNRNIRNFNF